jgi:hypothetical protein
MGLAPIALTLWKEKAMGIENERVREGIKSIGLDPDDANLKDRLRYTKSARLRTIFGKNFKIQKGEEEGVLTAVMHLSPSIESGFNTCPFATSCANVCIKTTGQLVTNMARTARVSKTLFYHLFREDFMEQLRMELHQHMYLAKIKGMKPAVRLNGTSDILWERSGVIDEFQDIYWYDYTKVPLEKRSPPPNYHLTFSLSEGPESMGRAVRYLEAGHNAAVVVQTAAGMTRTTAKEASRQIVEAGVWKGFPVVSGDEDDIRFWDPPGHWVILHAKGPATKDTTGFVQRVALSDLLTEQRVDKTQPFVA